MKTAKTTKTDSSGWQTTEQRFKKDIDKLAAGSTKRAIAGLACERYMLWLQEKDRADHVAELYAAAWLGWEEELKLTSEMREDIERIEGALFTRNQELEKARYEIEVTRGLYERTRLCLVVANARLALLKAEVAYEAEARKLHVAS